MAMFQGKPVNLRDFLPKDVLARLDRLAERLREDDDLTKAQRDAIWQTECTNAFFAETNRRHAVLKQQFEELELERKLPKGHSRNPISWETMKAVLGSDTVERIKHD